MNIVLLFSGIAALALGLLLETLIRASKSKTLWRARVFIVLGILLVVMGVFQFGGGGEVLCCSIALNLTLLDFVVFFVNLL